MTIAWLKANWTAVSEIIGFVIVVMSTVKQACDRHPTAQRILGAFIDILSAGPRKGARGVLGKHANLPGVPSLPEKVERDDDDDQRPAGGIPLGRVIRAAVFVGFILPVVVVSGCGTTKAQWRAAGIDVARCLHPAVVDAASDAIVAYLDTVATSSTPDYVQVGKTIASKYGPDVALCAIGKIWANLGGGSTPILSKPTPVFAATAYLVNHQDEWLYPSK
jgi:hypothetical protein